MAKSSQGGFKRFLNVLFNIFWVIFCGWVLALLCLLLGVVMCVLIFPIFLGIPGVFFRMIPLCFAPAGKHVRIDFSKGLIRNVICLILFGAVSTVSCFTYGFVLCCTIIGIPLGFQMFKFGIFFLAPFGSEIVKN